MRGFCQQNLLKDPSKRDAKSGHPAKVDIVPSAPIPRPRSTVEVVDECLWTHAYML